MPSHRSRPLKQMWSPSQVRSGNGNADEPTVVKSETGSKNGSQAVSRAGPKREMRSKTGSAITMETVSSDHVSQVLSERESDVTVTVVVEVEEEQDGESAYRIERKHRYPVHD